MSMKLKAMRKIDAILKTITGVVSSVNSTAGTISCIADSYDGLRLGFELKKMINLRVVV